MGVWLATGVSPESWFPCVKSSQGAFPPSSDLRVKWDTCELLCKLCLSYFFIAINGLTYIHTNSSELSKLHSNFSVGVFCSERMNRFLLSFIISYLFSSSWPKSMFPLFYPPFTHLSTSPQLIYPHWFIGIALDKVTNDFLMVRVYNNVNSNSN